MTRHELRTRCEGWPHDVVAGAVRTALKTTGRTVGLTRSEIPEFSDHVAAWLVNDTVTAEPTWLNLELPDRIWAAMQTSVQ